MKKYCCIYASWEHLKLILLPYINEKLNLGQKIVIKSEDEFGKSKFNMKDIFKLKKEDEEIINKLLKSENTERSNLKIIVGDSSFIAKEEKYSEINNDTDILISCYNLENEGLFSINLVEKYEKILRTDGARQIEEIFTRIPKKIYKEITILK